MEILLANVPFETPIKNVFVVNPGDLRSFIGNGMSSENSVEDIYCCKRKRLQSSMAKYSFLHNPYFNPALFNPVKSANIGNIVWKETMEW